MTTGNISSSHKLGEVAEANKRPSKKLEMVDAVDAVDAGPKASRVLHRIVQTCANLNTITNAAPSIASSEEFLNFSFS